jgi:hypothetical protein
MLVGDDGGSGGRGGTREVWRGKMGGRLCMSCMLVDRWIAWEHVGDGQNC